MTENIQQILIDYLQNTKDFMLEQIPQVLQETLRYEKISAYLSGILMLILTAVAGSIFYYFWKYPKIDTYGSRTMASVMGMYFPSGASILFFISLCVSVDRLIRIYVAPKYFLIRLFTD